MHSLSAYTWHNFADEIIYNVCCGLSECVCMCCFAKIYHEIISVWSLDHTSCGSGECWVATLLCTFAFERESYSQLSSSIRSQCNRISSICVYRQQLFSSLSLFALLHRVASLFIAYQRCFFQMNLCPHRGSAELLLLLWRRETRMQKRSDAVR